MQSFRETIILRHRRENLKKCSLRGLEKKAGFKFFTYPKDTLPDLPGYILLTVNAPPLSPEDAAYGLLLLDATWRYAETMEKQINKPLLERSLPSHFRTAYPRRQEDCIDPELGLASVEALYLAYYILGRDTTGILDFYHWKEEFLSKNSIEI